MYIAMVFCFIARWSLFGSGDPIEFWQVILKFASPASVGSIFDMEEIQTDLGRVTLYVCVCVHVHVVDTDVDIMLLVCGSSGNWAYTCVGVVHCIGAQY